MVQVTELSYMGIGVANLDEWKNFAARMIGMELAEGEERDRCYLRMDYWHHRIVLHAGDSDDLMYLGFRVAGPEEFREMQQQLSSAGIQFHVGSDQEAGDRHVLEVMKLNDPDGNPIEIFHGPQVQYSKPFHPGRGMHGRFKTGAGGLGHCIIREKDVPAAIRFYKALGSAVASNTSFKWASRSPCRSSCTATNATIRWRLESAGQKSESTI